MKNKIKLVLHVTSEIHFFRIIQDQFLMDF